MSTSFCLFRRNIFIDIQTSETLEPMDMKMTSEQKAKMTRISYQTFLFHE